MKNKRTRIGAILVSVAVSGVAAAAGDPAAGSGKAATCTACHGPEGNSVNAEWPKLAGQIPEYVAKQLHDFKSGKRSDQMMSPMAQPLTEQDIRDLAAYYGSQKVQAGASDADKRALGEKIYTKGKQRPTVVACIGCHGATGQGNREWGQRLAAPPAVLAPALGSQHQTYIVKQLKAYQQGTRKNDVGHVMRDIADRLTEQDMVAVAEYIATLGR
jgi:cytochrome c553